jgi:hypothetical protein
MTVSVVNDALTIAGAVQFESPNLPCLALF